MSEILNLESKKVLKKYWGFDSFYPDQENIINSILSGNDTICLIPTGGGKSLCFQVPALVFDGLCLVVSPLIALIEDQVSRLKLHNIPAEGLHSGLHQSKQIQIVDLALTAKLKLLYISPERLQSTNFRNIISRLKISFIAIDESHCISQWGYDFRPEYRMIHNIKEIKPDIQICAFTASANKQVISDILLYLKIKKYNLFQSSFLKPNILFGVIKSGNKLKLLEKLLEEFHGSGIIYMRSRAGTEKLSRKISSLGYENMFYHAGLSPESRSKIQSQWINNEFRIIISTTAFGMGIDKPDVRFVIHYDLPTSMEEYYQEAGRAGRDKLNSHAVILYNERDIISMKIRDLDNFPTYDEIESTFQNLKKYFNSKHNLDNADFDFDEFVLSNKIGKLKTYNSILELERYGNLFLNVNPKESYSLLKIINFDIEKLRFILNPTEFSIINYLIFNINNITQSNIRISESALAENMNIEKDYLIDIFRALSSKQIIFYEHRDIPIQLIMENSDFVFNRKELDFRRNRIISNFETIKKYIETTECRQKYILQYFDENLKENCNSCDICSGVNDSKLKTEFKLKFETILSNFGDENSFEIEDLIYRDSYLNRNNYLAALKYYVENGKLEVFGDKIRKIS